MTARVRNILYGPAKQAGANCGLTNLLVAGCSYTWNNSDQHACTWPYYLQRLLGMHQVLDCSQSGSGPDLAFNSIINEIVTNPLVNPETTMILVMWPELSRTDVIVTLDDMLERYHDMSLYRFTDNFANLSIYNQTDQGHTAFDDLAARYKRVIATDAQEYQSLLKMRSLAAALDNEDFYWMFLSWDQPDLTRLKDLRIPDAVVKSLDLVEPIQTLASYARTTDQTIPGDGHPTSEAHLEWTRQVLLPHMAQRWPSIISI